MKLEDLGEFALIDRIARGSETGEQGHVIRGIGDDAAVIKAPDGVLVLTTDMLVERVHFVRGVITNRQLGYKSLAVNLSDIAAMGATPYDAFVSIAVPGHVSVEELDDLFDGMKSLARSTRVNLLGGDFTRSLGDLCINVAVVGFAPDDEVLYRSGARVGDRILVTGSLGDAAGGLAVIEDRPELDESYRQALLDAHFRPEIYLEEARILAASGAVGAAIDLSDGLAADLGHVCGQSGVGAVVDGSAIPVSEPLRELCVVIDRDPLELAVSGGEDYRLLVTVDPGRSTELMERIAGETGRRLHDIGEIVAGEKIVLHQPSGDTVELEPSGWDHFANR